MEKMHFCSVEEERHVAMYNTKYVIPSSRPAALLSTFVNMLVTPASLCAAFFHLIVFRLLCYRAAFHLMRFAFV